MRISLAVVALMLSSAAHSQFTRIQQMRNGSGTVLVAGQSQTVFPINADRNYLFCQNPINATETLFVNYDAPATMTGGSIELQPGGTTTFPGTAVPTTIITVTAATAGHRFICKEGGAF